MLSLFASPAAKKDCDRKSLILAIAQIVRGLHAPLACFSILWWQMERHKFPSTTLLSGARDNRGGRRCRTGFARQ
jgi:hypothetical protein